MNNDEYVIINKTQILKRIEELASRIYENSNVGNMLKEVDKLLIQELKQILSQSTPLIPEIEKLIVMASTSDIDFLPDRVEKIKQDYIAKLKT